MKVHLVFAPPLLRSRVAPVWEAALPPLGILYLAAYLEKECPGVELRVTDGLLLGAKRTLADVLSFGADVLCVSFFTGSALGAYDLVQRVSAEMPGVYVIAGGPHATALPEDVLSRSATHVVVRGEGEHVLAELIKRLAQKHELPQEQLAEVKGVAYRDEAGIVRVTEPASYVVDLDVLPFPAWHLLSMRDYRGYHLCKQSPEAPILFSRGCPRDCTFCPNEHWNLSTPKVRFRTPKNVVDEIEELRHNYGIREFNNLADELNNHPAIALQICQEIKRRKLDITWKTMLRSDHVSEDLVRSMAESGCWLVSLGIETGNPATMQGIKKHFTHEDVESTAHLIKKYGMRVQGYFMLFNVWEENGTLAFEDTDMSQKTVRYAENLFDDGLLDYMGWSVATPYPGSELFHVAERHTLIRPELQGQWDRWAQDALFVMALPGVPTAEQIRVTRRAQTLGARASLLRNGIRMADLPMMFKTAIHTVRTEARLAIGKPGGR